MLASNEKLWRSIIDKGVDSYMRRWLLFRKTNTSYGFDEISDRGEKVKNLTAEMFNRKRIFVDTKSRAERKESSHNSLEISFMEFE